MSERDQITAHMFLPDMVERYPATRTILDRYGLQGCGGPLGPREPVDWFARLHGVPLDRLLKELNEAARTSGNLSVEFKPSIADTIYRPFFIAAITTLLTLGCVWGAINLFTIGRQQSFGATPYSWVLAHGHAMVVGFVGFFIMGFAYQAFPRFKHSSLWRPWLAFSALPIMVAGIILQTVAHLIAPRAPFLTLGIVAGIVQVVAVAIFALVIFQTARLSEKPENYDRFVYAALGWFLVAAIANPIIFMLFEAPGSRENLLFNLATFNIPYRDVQLVGVAVMMILGVSLRLLPHAYGLREPSWGWQSFMFWGVNAALLLGVITFIQGMATGNHWLLTLQWLSSVLLLAVALGLPRQYRLFGPVPVEERDRGLKFIRAAHVWFIVATLMLVAVPLYNFGIYTTFAGGKIPFSHAYFGAYRHALTVGLIMMMIVGVSSKVVPTLSGVDVRSTTSLWPTFVLLNLGNALRVSTEIATDFTPYAYRIMGISGFIEVVGLGFWAFELMQNMRVGKRLERTSTGVSALSAFTITPQTKVSDVLAHYPQSLAIFLQHGFTPLSNPVLRRTLARVVTLEQACRREGINLQTLLSDLQSCSSTASWTAPAER